MKRVIIGLDGVPYRLIEDLSASGVMPHLGALRASGIFKQMASSIPEVSSVAWSSIITGKNPGEHGIFGFTGLRPGSYDLFFPNFHDLGARPFWERAGSGRSVIINVPSTYPARRLNGALISGFVALDLRRATYPPSLVPQLERIDYRLDVDSAKARQSMGLFLDDLEKTLNSRIAAYRSLWEGEAWETFMLVFTGTDRLAHFLWKAYEDEAHEYHSAFLDHFRRVDEIIGEITSRLEEEDLLILLSDHGFESLEEEVYVNYLLRREGFLQLEGGSPDLSGIAQGTRAFALDPGRIYLNLRGRYPRGEVGASDRDPVIADLTNLFTSLELDGRRVINRVYRREELYSGPFSERAPDLVLLAARGFNLKGDPQAEQLFGKSIFTGKHSQPDAFLLVRANSKALPVPARPGLTDVIGLIDRFREL